MRATVWTWCAVTVAAVVVVSPATQFNEIDFAGISVVAAVTSSTELVPVLLCCLQVNSVSYGMTEDNVDKYQGVGYLNRSDVEFMKLASRGITSAFLAITAVKTVSCLML